MSVQRWLAVDDIIKLEACDRTPARIMKGRALLTKRNHCLNMELAEAGIKMLSKQKPWEHGGGQLPLPSKLLAASDGFTYIASPEH